MTDQGVKSAGVAGGPQKGVMGELSPWGWVAVAAVVAAVLRLAHLSWLLSVDPLLLEPMVDAAAYHHAALDVLADPIGDELFYQAPGYPYAVAIVYALFGTSWEMVSAVQASLAAASVGLIAVIAARVTPTRQAPVAVVASAWLMALYQPLIFYSVLVLKVALTNFWMLASLAALVHGLACLRVVGGSSAGPGSPSGAAPEEETSKAALTQGDVAGDEVDPTMRPTRSTLPSALGWIGLSGVLMGILLLFRGNFFLCVPLLVAWIVLRWGWGWRAEEAWARSIGVVGALKAAAVFGIGIALVLGLLATRNKVVADQWTFSSGHSGAVLYVGNNPYSPLGDYKHMPFVRTNPIFERDDFQAEAQRRTGRPMTAAEVSRFWRQEAIQYSLDNPLVTARRGLHKVRLLMESYELGDNYSLSFHSEFSPFVNAWFPWWSLVMALSLAWLMGARQQRLEPGPVWVVLIAYAASCVITFVRSRYRIPMAPLMIILAGLEIALFVTLVRLKRWKPVALHGGIAVLVLGLGLAFGLPRMANEVKGNWWMALGIAHSEDGDIEGARALLTKALQVQPEEPIIWMNAGKMELGQDNVAQAEKLCTQAVALDGTRADSRECLGLARMMRGDAPGAWEALEPVATAVMPADRFKLVVYALQQTDQSAKALKLVDEGLRLQPGEGELYFLRATLTRLTSPERARADIEKAIELTSVPARREELRALLKSLDAPPAP